MKFEKAYEIRELIRRNMSSNNLISGVFADFPELNEIHFERTQDYDDNNYSDSYRLLSVNGWGVDWDGERIADDGGFEEEESSLPKPSQCALGVCRDLVSIIANEFDYEEHRLLRSCYFECVAKNSLSKEESEYLHSYITNQELPEKWFVRKDAKWACYYGLDHGRFKEDVEFKIFAKKNRAKHAYWYAFHVIKGRLPEPIENFFILSSMSGDDNEWIKRYMEFRDSVVAA